VLLSRETFEEFPKFQLFKVVKKNGIGTDVLSLDIQRGIQSNSTTSLRLRLKSVFQVEIKDFQLSFRLGGGAV
jgi:hypothetical protein